MVDLGGDNFALNKPISFGDDFKEEDAITAKPIRILSFNLCRHLHTATDRKKKSDCGDGNSRGY